MFLAGSPIPKGTPIPNATVTLKGTEVDVFSTMRTAQNGRFAFPAVSAPFELRVEAPGFIGVTMTPASQLSAEGAREIDIVLTSAQGAREAGQGPAVPPDVLRMARTEFGPDLQDCLESNKEQFEQMIRVTRLRLSTGTRPALLIEGLGPCLAGANNGPLIIYAFTNAKWRKVFDGIGQRVDAPATRTRGWRDLELWRHDSAFKE